MARLFDESRLDDEEALARADIVLRPLAEAGARVRREAGAAAEAIEAAVAAAAGDARPRAVIAAGPDSRLLRAVLEPWCPVPFVAWPGPSLPGWAGSLDLVVVLSPEGSDSQSASAVAEAVRRGCQCVVACPEHSLVAEHAEGRHSTVLPVDTRDQLATAVVMLEFLDRLDLGPETDPEAVATALDDVAISCSPYKDLAVNPAKMLAIALADSLPLVWGGSVLAARAARRVAESIRRTSGRAALAADAEHLLPVISAARRRDVFADPYADPDADPYAAPYDDLSDPDAADRRPILMILDDGSSDASVREQRGRLVAAARERDVRVETVTADASNEVARYAALLATGTFAAAYLGVGLDHLHGGLTG
ncbi:MAG TPA: SIS domain-containing protein [Nocardioidaceae bacterium]|nr:SIS domain-containing protein [Nocardioidaceae bacterium]